MNYFKKACFLIAALGTFVALLYAFENWRGARYYHRTLDQLRDNGEELDFAKLVPTTVPEDENFGSASFLKGLKQTGASGSPQATLETVYESIRVVEEAETPSEFLELARQLRDEKGSDLKPMEYLASQLEGWQPVRSELVERLPLPYARWNRSFESGGQADSYEVFNFAILSLMKLAAIQAQVHLINADSAGALDDIRIGLRIGEMYRHEPGWIFHVLFLANLALMGEPIDLGLKAQAWNRQQLDLLGNELSKLDFRSLIQTAMRGDRAFTLTFSEAATNVARLHVFGESLPAWMHLAPTGWGLRGLAVVAEAYDDGIEGFNDTHVPLGIQLKTWNARVKELETIRPTAWTASLAASKLTGLGDASLEAARKTALHQAVIGICRFQLEHGDYPVGLEELASIPRDPSDNQPLAYQRLNPGFRIEAPDDNDPLIFEMSSR